MNASFGEYLKSLLSNAGKTSGLLTVFQGILPTAVQLSIYKSFARPQRDYVDIICDQTLNKSFQKRIESLQYN